MSQDDPIDWIKRAAATFCMQADEAVALMSFLDTKPRARPPDNLQVDPRAMRLLVAAASQRLLMSVMRMHDSHRCDRQTLAGLFKKLEDPETFKVLARSGCEKRLNDSIAKWSRLHNRPVAKVGLPATA